MLLKHLTVQRFLSFDYDGIALDMRDLNVLIGPNGSGKSNLLEVLAFLKAMPDGLGKRFGRQGSFQGWSNASAPGTCLVKVASHYARAGSDHFHLVMFDLDDKGITINAEKIHADRDARTGAVYEFERGSAKMWDANHNVEAISIENLDPSESILAQVRDPAG